MSATQTKTKSEKAHDIQCRIYNHVFVYASDAKGDANAPGFFQAFVTLEDDEDFWLEHKMSDTGTVLKAIRRRRGGMFKALWALYNARKDKGLPVACPDLLQAYQAMHDPI